MKTKAKKIILFCSIALLVMAGSGIAAWLVNKNKSSSSNSLSTTAATVASADDSGDINWDTLPTTNVSLTDQGLSITEAGTYILTGTTTGQVVVKSDGYVRIVLDGVTISSANGPAVYIESAKKAVVTLAENSTNSITDSSTRSDETIDGALYSADDLVVNGTGSLTVTAKYADGIVGKDDLWINSGSISIKSVDDGIRGKDSLTITGGTIAIDAEGDGMKASNDTDSGKGQLVITGGDITINTADDAIKAEQKISITGGTIAIPASVEGIEAPIIVIDGGDITLYATDDGINASASAIVTSGFSVTINGGNLTIEVGPGDTDGIDSNGDLYINGGTVSITAQVSSLDFDGNGAINGGTVMVNGSHITTMPAQMMGGGGRR